MLKSPLDKVCNPKLVLGQLNSNILKALAQEVLKYMEGKSTTESKSDC